MVHHARRSLGQHYLLDLNITDRMVRTAGDLSKSHVVEIGPGRGALTKPLIKRAGRLLAVELDRHLAQKLHQQLGNQAKIVSADFLDFALPVEAYSVIGNIPYAITTGIIRKLTEARSPPSDAWLIVQRELAHRFCGSPFAAETLWSLRLKPNWHLEIVRGLKRTDFDPPPSVESVLLRISSRGRPLLSDAELLLYEQIIESAYRNGGSLGKTMRPWLSKVQLRRLANDLHFEADGQPATLRFEQWLGILRFVWP